MNVIAPGHRLTAYVAAALVSSAAPAVSPAAATAAPSAGQAASSLVVAPKSGKRISSHLVRIVVRSPDGPGALDARLNGMKVGEEFGPAKRGLRTLTVSVSHGLKRGRNTLRVRVHVGGRKDRTATRRFVVTTKGPLVGAGRDRRIVVGTRVPLASRVVPHPNAGSRSRSIRWRHVRSSARGSRSRHATLRRSTSRQASFTARTPGRHTVRMTLGSGRSDNVTVTAVPASALQIVDTGATLDGRPAIRVGDDVYKAPIPAYMGEKTFVQLLVFQRESLQFVSNTVHRDTNTLAAALAPLTDGHLVIAALRTTPLQAVSPPYNMVGSRSLADVLGRIGFPSPAVVGGLDDRAGETVSAIGVPGMQPGEADVNTNPGGAAMKGYLLPDRFFEYGFVSPDLKQVTQPTLPGGACSSGCSAGFTVTVFDQYTLQPLDGQTFLTNPEGSNNHNAAFVPAYAMTQYLNAIPAGRLVRIGIQSRLAPGSLEFLPAVATGARGPEKDDMDRLTDAVAKIGGTRNGFNRAAIQYGAPGGQQAYSLIGWAGAGEANGAEAAKNVDGVGPNPILSATLRRDRTHQYRPVHSTAFGATPSPIQDLALSAPGTGKWWPAGLPGAAGLKRALGYLGAKVPVVDLTCDPQSHFWLELDTATEANTARNDLKDKVKMPGAGDTNPCTGQAYSIADFTKDDFTKAKAELLDELDDVADVRTLMETLAAPFDGTAGLNAWTDTQKLADEIYNSAKKPEAETGLNWVELTEILLKLAGPLTGHFSAVAAEMLQFGDWVAGAADQDGSPSGEEVRFQADEIGTEIVDRAEDQAANLRRVGDIFVSDPAKMVKLLCEAGGTCPPEFKAPNSVARTEATAAAARAVRRTAYTKLFGLGYRVTFTNPYPDNRFEYNGAKYGFPHNDGTAPPEPARYDCGGFYVHPFYDWHGNAWDALLQTLSPSDLRNNVWQPIVVTTNPGSDIHATPPPDDMLADMFGPVPATNDPKAPGLGMSLTDLSYESKRWGWREYEHPSSDTGCTWDIP